MIKKKNLAQKKIWGGGHNIHDNSMLQKCIWRSWLRARNYSTARSGFGGRVPYITRVFRKKNSFFVQSSKVLTQCECTLTPIGLQFSIFLTTNSFEKLHNSFWIPSTILNPATLNHPLNQRNWNSREYTSGFRLLAWTADFWVKTNAKLTPISKLREKSRTGIQSCLFTETLAPIFG